ncbi:dipeptidase [Fredinandcohnia sp. QZ13]|uniref:dipeptidase n=1 Tax=Fredinandcohnia sp. QZ13 TaxID=3073144 RepID=UPI0028532538|nr:dipeptidase [Fredinandcohnia sp. QZ13]MDR4886418.1 dipeptidase [Fredinandcohnia sp. QZ13]
MKIFDAHSDVLYKMWMDPTIDFADSPKLHITYNQLKAAGSKVQCFAIYIPEEVRPESRFETALEMVEIFYKRVIAPSPLLKAVRTREDILALKENEIGAFLTLEGCDAIDQSIVKLQTLIRLGVSSVGLTWNYANFVADGIGEPRGAGLSSFGKEVVKEHNRSFIWTDVSHLSIKGFWDVMEIADYPIASHSNAISICNHRRNLQDDQIRALIQKNGMIGVTFVPQFLSNRGTATINDVLKHLDYICSLGGENHVGFGSDFDGITETTTGLECFLGYEILVNNLLKHYTESQVRKFLYDNFIENLPV